MKKRILALLLCFALCLSLMSVGVLAYPGDYDGYFDGGTGEENDPYRIATLGQLENLAAIVNSGDTCADTCFVLTADIGSSKAPVTAWTSSPFSGHFDGAGHTVTLGIMEDSTEYVALFFYLVGGSIANLTTAGFVIGAGYVCGVCCATSGGVIENCLNTATIISDGYTAGVCFLNQDGGVITNCVNSGYVSGNSTVSGICCVNAATVRNCTNSGYVSGSGTAGGVCGENGGSIENCLNSGGVDSENSGAGGVCGLNSGVITNCCGFGSVTADHGAGCVCCTNDGNVIHCCYDAFSPNGGIDYSYVPYDAAGLSGSSEMVDLLNSYADSTGSYPAGWRTWTLGGNGPEFAHRFTGDYVQGTGDNAGKHARKCSDPGCDAVGYTDDSGNPVEGYVECSCDQEVVADAYIKTDATCVSKTVYYKSCVCGYCGRSYDSETFEDPYGDDPTGHAWKYSAVSNVLIATCESERCTDRASASLVLNARDKVYDGHSAEVSILGGDTWEALMGSGSLPTIEYYDSTGNQLEEAPTNAGSYTAKITASGAQFGATAEAAFTILPGPAVPIPAGATYTYDGNEKTFMTLFDGIDFDSTTADYNASTCEFIGTDAGTYQVVLRLSDPNSMWSDGTTEARTITFTIDPASIIIHVKDKTATVGDSAAPALSEDDFTFLKGPVANDLITVTLSYQYLDLNQEGSYDIQATISGDRSRNYQLFVAPGTLFVTAAGGSGPAEVPVPPVFYAHNLTLGSEISLNFYLDVPDECKSDTNRLTLTVGGRSFTPDRESYELDGKALERYCLPLNVLQMAEEVEATYTYADGKTVTETYSAEDYLKLAQKKSAGDEALNALVNATYAYGYYSQRFLAESHGFTLGEDYSALTYDGAPDVAAAKANVTAPVFPDFESSETLSDVKLSLLLDSKTTLRVYITVKDGAAPTVTLGKTGLEVFADTQANTWYADVAELAAHQLGKDFTLEVNGETVAVSALSFCCQVLNAEAGYEYAESCAAAIYEYYMATMGYRK